MATGRVPTTANSPLTAKGDLFGYSTTQARVPVGNDGETLVADSSTSTGLRYIPATVTSNPIINGGFDIWQRGTSFASYGGAELRADRWLVGTYDGLSTTTVSRQLTGDTTNLPNIQYAMRFGRPSGSTRTDTIYAIQSIETANSVPFAGRTITFSAYVRRGANFSGTSNLFAMNLYTGTGTDQSIYSGYTGQANPISVTNTATTTWQRFTATATLASNTNEIGVVIQYSPTGTAGANDYLEITGVQIDVGNVALPFRRNGATLAGELAACQRYYEKSYDVATAPGTATASGAVGGKVSSNTVANQEFYGSVTFAVQKRGTPSITVYGYNGGTNKVSESAGGVDLAANSGTATWIGNSGFVPYNNSGGTLTTSYFNVLFHWVASAEL